MSQEISKKDGEIKLQIIEKHRKKIMEIIPAGEDKAYLFNAISHEVRSHPDLWACSPKSLLFSIMECVKLGLTPGANQGLAYFIPYQGECSFMLGYKGMLRLLHQHTGLRVVPKIVYENDYFEYDEGTNPAIVHKPSIDNRGDWRAVYMVVNFPDDVHPLIHLMAKQDIYKIRDMSRGRNHKAWKEHEIEMARKTVIRNGFKYTPLSPILNRALILDEKVEAGLSQSENGIFEGEFETIEEETKENKATKLGEELKAQL